jgi:DNA-directed RNA polymerase specialized sigma24 family protein
MEVEPIDPNGGESDKHDRDGVDEGTGEGDIDGLLRRERSTHLLQAVREDDVLCSGADCRGRMPVSVAPSTWTSSSPELPLAEAVWSDLHERLRGFVARRVPDRVVVDDLAQDILLRLYTHMGRLREQERLDAWAYQVARTVAISNCVINLSTDKPAVFRELARVVAPGGRVAISDIVSDDDVSPAERAERGSNCGCIAGALSKSEYETLLRDAGFEDVSVELRRGVAGGMHSADVRARKPPA